jgi:hypothetical protein
MMFAGALKALGLDAKVIDSLSRGLLNDLQTVARLAPEMLARQEAILRALPARDPAHASAWVDYLKDRSEEFERLGELYNPGGGSGHPPGGGNAPA